MALDALLMVRSAQRALCPNFVIGTIEAVDADHRTKSPANNLVPNRDSDVDNPVARID